MYSVALYVTENLLLETVHHWRLNQNVCSPQSNEIDLEALLLMSDKDFSEIGPSTGEERVAIDCGFHI